MDKPVDRQPMIQIFAPELKGRVWSVEAIITTPWGPFRLTGEGDEVMATRAFAMVQNWLKRRADILSSSAGDDAGGFFDDLSNGVRAVAQSKAFRSVMGGAQMVLKNPVFRQVAGYIPVVSNVVNAADGAFDMVNKIQGGVTSALDAVQQIRSMAGSRDPSVAAQGKDLLAGLAGARSAQLLLSNAERGDRAAVQRVRDIRQQAQKGDPRAKDALRALDAARAFERKTVAARLVNAAIKGDARANSRIATINRQAEKGDPIARRTMLTIGQVIGKGPPVPLRISPPPPETVDDYIPHVLTTMDPEVVELPEDYYTAEDGAAGDDAGAKGGAFDDAMFTALRNLRVRQGSRIEAVPRPPQPPKPPPPPRQPPQARPQTRRV